MTARVIAERLDMPRALQAFWKISVGLGLLCIGIEAFNRYVLHWGYPYNSPFLQFNHFVDFYDFQNRFSHYHQVDFFSTLRGRGSAFSYPAPAGMLYELFYLPRKREHSIFTLVTMTPVVGLGWVLIRQMVARGIDRKAAIWLVGSSLAFSFPFWFEYMLGNIEIVVFLIVTFALLAMFRGHLYLGAGLIGLAGSMKLFPFVYLGLLLSQKKYREMAFGVLTAAVVYPVAMWLECPSYTAAREGMKAGAGAIGNALVLQWHWAETSFDHSIFGFYKQLAHLWGFSNTRTPHQLSIYMACAAAGGIALYFLRIRHLPVMNQLLSLCVCSIILPPMSHDYTLLYLYLPWALLALAAMEDAARGIVRPGMMGAFVCFGLLFSPQSDIIVRHAAVAGQFKACVLVYLLWIALTRKFAMPIALQWVRADAERSAVSASSCS